MSLSEWESTLNSRILANYFKEICKSFAPPYREADMWINQQKVKSNNKLIFFLSQTTKLIKEGRINPETFKSEIKKINDLGIVRVELLWYLEFFQIMTVMEFIQFHDQHNNREVLQHISQQVFDSLLDYKRNSSEVRKKMLSFFMKTVLEYSKNDFNNSETSFYQIQMNLFHKNLNRYYSSEENDVDCYLEVSYLNELFSNPGFDYTLIQLFFQQILLGLLETSEQTIKSAFKKQEQFKNDVVNKKIWQFFVTISKHCNLDFMMEQLQTVLLQSTKGINWSHLLCLVTFVGKHYADGWKKLKILSNLVIKVALQNLDSKLLSHAFLIARQGCFEKVNDSFPSYLQWFSSTFSSDLKKPLNSRKVCSFFFNFLTDLLSYEPTYYLKVHINKLPVVPPDCHLIAQEYTELVKAHLGSLNVSIEFGICENRTNKSAAVYDVESVLKHFERTNDILNSVFQASMFCKEYYEKKFLVELLSKFEGKKSVKHKFILKLQSLGKIPNAMFKAYKALEKQAK